MKLKLKKYIRVIILICLKGGYKMQDKTIVCKDCGAEFVFTVAEQEFYAEKGFQNEPVRCKECRWAKKNRSRN